jgi:hypothetical protein
MTTDTSVSVRASRYRVPRTRGALSGFLLIVLGAWAALAPMVGPYFDLAYTPAPNDAWHWTAGRGWLEVLPGAAAFLGGVLLLVSASRVVTMLGGWLAAAAGAWLIVGPSLADPLNIGLGTPDPASSTGVRALEALAFFFAAGAAILLFAALALGRLSVLSLRDVRAAERRVAAEQAAEEAAAPTAYRAYPAEGEDVGRHGLRPDGTPMGSEDGADATAAETRTMPAEGEAAPAEGGTGQSPSYTEPTYARTAPPPPEQR